MTRAMGELVALVLGALVNMREPTSRGIAEHCGTGNDEIGVTLRRMRAQGLVTSREDRSLHMNPHVWKLTDRGYALRVRLLAALEGDPAA